MYYEKADNDQIKKIDTIEIISIKELRAEIQKLKAELELYPLKTKPDQETLELWNRDNFDKREFLKGLIADKQQLLTLLLELR
jgi:hypothetical protein